MAILRVSDVAATRIGATQYPSEAAAIEALKLMAPGRYTVDSMRQQVYDVLADLYAPRWADLIPEHIQVAGHPLLSNHAMRWWLDPYRLSASPTKLPVAPTTLPVTHVWGPNADDYPAPFQSNHLEDFQSFRARTIANYAGDCVLMITPGVHTQNWYMGDRPWSRIVVTGPPSGTATLSQGSFAIQNFDAIWFQDLDFAGFRILSQRYKDSKVRVHMTRCSARDQLGDVNFIGSPDEPLDVEYHFWDNYFTNLGSIGNLRHTIYVHGRRNAYLNWNDNEVMGAKGCSIIKSTCVQNRVRNSFLSAVADLKDPALGYSASIVVDIPSDSETSIYNNQIIAWRGPSDGLDGHTGTDLGAIFPRCRREFEGSDRPTYESAEFWDPTFWTQRAVPFTWVIARNHFKMLAGRVCKPLIAAGTHPRRAAKTGGNSIILPVPKDWWERLRLLDIENTYDGFPNDDWNLAQTEAFALPVPPDAKWGATRLPASRVRLTTIPMSAVI